jgi:hypothetical protein
MVIFRLATHIVAACVIVVFAFTGNSTGQVPTDTIPTAPFQVDTIQAESDQNGIIKNDTVQVDLFLTDTIQTDQMLTDDAKTSAGLVTFVDGTLKKKADTDFYWTIAQKDTTVVSGEKVRTMIDSRAEIELRALDVLRMAPKTTIDIVKLYEETKSQKDQTEIEVEEGDIWAMVGEVETGAEFNLNTPVAGAAITGTVFRVSVDEDSSTQLKVYKGEVHISNAPGNKNLQPEPVPTTGRKKVSGPQQTSGPRQVTLREWLYIVKDMQSIRISKKGEVLDSGSFTTDDEDEQSDWVRWNKERDTQRKQK